jgi:predicted GNAT family acetyltransferase
MLLMRYPGAQAPAVPERGVEVRVVAAGDEAGRQTWADVVMSQEDTDDPEERAMWEEVTRREARYPLCRHYLGYLDGQAAGACELFMAEGWGRIESVVTRAAFRRRGVATAVVAQAVADSLAFGHSETYLYTEQGGAGEQVYLRLGFETRAVSPLRRHLS